MIAWFVGFAGGPGAQQEHGLAGRSVSSSHCLAAMRFPLYLRGRPARTPALRTRRTSFDCARWWEGAGARLCDGAGKGGIPSPPGDGRGTRSHRAAEPRRLLGPCRLKNSNPATPNRPKPFGDGRGWSGVSSVGWQGAPQEHGLAGRSVSSSHCLAAMRFPLYLRGRPARTPALRTREESFDCARWWEGAGVRLRDGAGKGGIPSPPGDGRGTRSHRAAVPRRLLGLCKL